MGMNVLQDAPGAASIPIGPVIEHPVATDKRVDGIHLEHAIDIGQYDSLRVNTWLEIRGTIGIGSIEWRSHRVGAMALVVEQLTRDPCSTTLI
jgi:hypothetical protein